MKLKLVILTITLISTISLLSISGLTKMGLIPNYLSIKPLNPFQESNNNQTHKVEEFYPQELPVMGKPVIYLYPRNKQHVNVQVKLDGTFITTYPTYNNGWKVTAYANGRIINETDNKEYSYLFWEGIPNNNRPYNLSLGFVVRGKDTAEFLQEKLLEIGLTPREYNEFIVYWMPKMKDNKYNLIHFASKVEYDDIVPLEIDPKPDSILRVFMVYKKLDTLVKIQPQEIKPFKREGFSVVEWGGTEIK